MATYLITQATGQQAQWTIKHLLAAGAKVHAIVRDPSKIPETLRHPDVKVFKGESVNDDDVFRAAQGCEGVYLNTFPIPGLELQQAQTILAASKRAGVKAVVACTTMCTGRRGFWDDEATRRCYLHDYYASKAAVEDAVRGAGLGAWTILRPAVLHCDLLLPHSLGNFPRLAAHGELDHYCDAGARLPYTDAADVGRYAAAALRDPARFAGHAVDMAVQALPMDEIRDIVARVAGRDDVVARRLVLTEAEPPAPGQLFHLWANHKDFADDLAASREAQDRFGIPLTSLEEALRRDKKHLVESLPVRG